jgi:hypothetical protein
MTPSLVPLYFLALISIGVLAAFARSNKKSGWVKPRPTFLEDLRDLQRAWEEEDQREARRAGPGAPALNEVTGFTSQLVQLQGALGDSAAPAKVETPAGVPEAVPK